MSILDYLFADGVSFDIEDSHFPERVLNRETDLVEKVAKHDSVLAQSAFQVSPEGEKIIIPGLREQVRSVH